MIDLKGFEHEIIGDTKYVVPVGLQNGNYGVINNGRIFNPTTNQWEDGEDVRRKTDELRQVVNTDPILRGNNLGTTEMNTMNPEQQGPLES